MQRQAHKCELEAFYSLGMHSMADWLAESLQEGDYI